MYNALVYYIIHSLPDVPCSLVFYQSYKQAVVGYEELLDTLMTGHQGLAELLVSQDAGWLPDI